MARSPCPSASRTAERSAMAGLARSACTLWICRTSRTPQALRAHVNMSSMRFGTIPFHTCYPLNADAAHPRLHEHSGRGARSARSGLPRELSHAVHDGREGSAQPENRRRCFRVQRRRKVRRTATSASRAAALVRTTRNAGWRPGTERPEIMVHRLVRRRTCEFSICPIPLAPKEVAWFVPPRDGEIENYDILVAGHDGECASSSGTET